MSAAEPPRVIQIRGLRKVFDGRTGPVVAVDGLDLDVFAGECFGLLGPNGAGKTTTVEILEGLGRPTDGEVEVLGLRWERDAGAIRQRIGVTLQETRFPDKMTVRELVAMFRSFYRDGLDADELLRRVALEAKAEDYVESLSGGQQRRLAVALALVGDPELLFFDEPTTGLDPQARRQLWDVIRELRGRGRTTVLTTHYMDEAERLCDRIAIVDEGKVIALGTPDELIASLGGEHLLEFTVGGAEAPPEPESFADLPTVTSARRDGDGFALTVDAPHEAIPALLDRLTGQGRHFQRLTTRRISLEDVFAALTGRHLRDDGADAAGSADGRPPSRRRGRRRAVAG